MSDLDTLIRQGLGHLVDTTPIAPSFEEVTQTLLRPATGRARFERVPRTHFLLAAAGVTALVGAGVSYAVVHSGTGKALTHRGAATIRLAGYTAHLPSGFLVRSVTEPTCQTAPLSALPFPLESDSTYTIATPDATACIGSFVSATYGTDGSTATAADPLPPSGSTPVRLGAYRAAVARSDPFATLCSSVGTVPACTWPPTATTPPPENAVAIWVQIPSTGGGYHDLVVGSSGLSETELTALVESALPKHVAAADAGHPPWSVIPVCAPGETPEPDAPSDQACSNT